MKYEFGMPANTIAFDLPRAANITLTAYDILGREIERLISRTMPAGSHSIVWDGSKLASGVYFIELKSHNYRTIKKALLMK